MLGLAKFSSYVVRVIADLCVLFPGEVIREKTVVSIVKKKLASVGNGG
jgi:hypothetical protein